MKKKVNYKKQQNQTVEADRYKGFWPIQKIIKKNKEETCMIEFW